MTDIVTLLAGPALLAVGALAAWGKEIVDRGHREQREDKAAKRQERLDKEARFEAQAKEYRDGIPKLYVEILTILHEGEMTISNINAQPSTPGESDDETHLRITNKIVSQQLRLLAAVMPLELDSSSADVAVESLLAGRLALGVFDDYSKWRSERTDKSLRIWPELDGAQRAVIGASQTVASKMTYVLEQYQPAFSDVRERMLQQAQQARMTRALSKEILPPESPA